MEKTDTVSIIRNPSVEKVSSPEQLSDYLRVTNPGVWVVLAAVSLLLAALLVWACVGTLETTADARIVVENRSAYVALVSEAKIEAGMTLRVAGQETAIAAVTVDAFGRPVGVTETALPDGTYEGVVVTGTIHPISFLLSDG